MSHDNGLEEYSENDFLLTINRFNKFGLTSFIVLIISALLSFFGGMLLVAFPVILFVLFPKLYKIIGIQKINKIVLKLSSSKWGKILSVVPGVSLSGKWFIEGNSEAFQFNNFKEILKFILNHWMDFFLIPIGIVISLMRIF